MKSKQCLQLILLLAISLSACTAASVDDLPGYPSPVSTANPDRPVRSDDPLSVAPSTPDLDNAVIDEANISSIEIAILESFPVQIQVLVTGTLPDGCTRIGPIDTRREGTVFDVTIHTVRPADAMCTQVISEFEEVVPLDVYGLAAGTYTVNVNGVTDTFTLDMDNAISEVVIDESAVHWDEIPPTDRAQLIRLTLERALLAKEIPDYELLANQEEIILSLKNIDPSLVPELPGVNLITMTPEEIQAKANDEGDFLYLEFQEIVASSPDRVSISLNNGWAVAENSKTGYLSGGGFVIEYVKEGDIWSGEVIGIWIS